MKIGFDISQTAENKAGCGFFADQLIRNIVNIDKNNEYLLYPIFYDYRNSNFKQATSIDLPNCKLIFEDKSWHEINKLWNEDCESRDNLLGNPSIVHSNSFRCPKDLKNSKTIVTIYDMGFIDYPEFTTEANRIICFNGAFESSLYADHIITISQFSKQRFLHYFPHYSSDKITVAYLGARESIKKVDRESGFKVLKRMGIDSESNFWLGVGTIEPRKNYSLLLEAYSQLNSENKEIFPLYIAGGKGWLEEDMQERIKALGILDKVKFLGYVSDEQLSALYSNCYAFIYPSFYEGFGLPVLEAMNCGAPVITSNTSSIPEVCADAAIMIDPKSEEELCESMTLLLNNEKHRAEMKEKGLERAKMFSWRNTAEEVLKVYNKLME